MKTIKIFLSITILATVLFSCSKDDDNQVIPTPVVNEQNPLSGYLTATGFNEKTDNVINNVDFELGLSFIPQANGKITELIVKIPDVHPDMRITVWDKATAAILRTELIDVTSSGVEIKKLIAPLDLVKDKEYMITYNTNDWYSHHRNDSFGVTYPVTVADVKITSFGYKSGTTQALPDTFIASLYAGDLSFTFVKS